jgi:hypothetical protein
MDLPVVLVCNDLPGVCPGCTGGRIPATMLMGYGVAIRYPVDYDGALRTSTIKYYRD